MQYQTASFQVARPVWLAGRETEKNLTVQFFAEFTGEAATAATLRVAAATIYRVSLNGEFLAHGPARGPHGFYRVDAWELGGKLRPGRNALAIEVAGYNATSYAYLDQPSFLQAEVVAGGRVLAATGSAADGVGGRFRAGADSTRVQRVSRFSYQRPFMEVYRLTPGFDQWKTAGVASEAGAGKLAEVPGKSLIPRRIGESDFSIRPAVWLVATGSMPRCELPEKPWSNRCITGIGAQLGGYVQSELEVQPHLELQRWVRVPMTTADRALNPGDRLELPQAGACGIVDFGANLTGFLGVTVECAVATTLYLAFDEILTDGDVHFGRGGCVNIIALELAAGRYQFESIEPNTFRYLKPVVLAGACSVAAIYLRQYANPAVWQAEFACSDRRVNALFDAGRETYRQNAVDLFMDCPSRERAGWLCDSFFTARVGMRLSGNATVETCFLENFLLPESFGPLPAGMLPMCYPSDHRRGDFIPNWAMWFVLELEEYMQRSGDRDLVDRLKPRVLALVDYFKPFLNADGLLQKLASWVFVEWSRANDFVQDVNYPSNMVYAGMLDAVARLYALPAFAAQAAGVRETIRAQSFNGEFFTDNRVLVDGVLTATANMTEVCQYYAFFFGVATPLTHPALWAKLVGEFGPKREAEKVHPRVFPANAFIGNYLRMELLSRYGLTAQLLDEARDYLLFMVDRTRTLWENNQPSASCNHGFASHVVEMLYRDVLGIQRVDRAAKTIAIRLAAVPLEFCSGRVPTESGLLSVVWWREGSTVHLRTIAPDGYKVTVANDSGRDLVRHA